MNVHPFIKLCAAGALLTLIACGKDQSQGSADPDSKSTAVSDLPKPRPHKPAMAMQGPFGLAKGISVTELTGEYRFKSLADASGAFEGTPPRPVEGVAEYLLLATKNNGLCKVIASTPSEPVNESGDQVRATVDRFAESLKIKYGDHGVKTSYVGDGMFKRNPDMWMIGLKEESVFYAYTWKHKDATPLPNDLASVEISAEAVGSSKGYAKIVYTFNNFADCAKEMKAVKAENL